MVTKWLTLVVPLIPVHSYILLQENALLAGKAVDPALLDKYTKASILHHQHARKPLNLGFDSALREVWWDQSSTLSQSFTERYWRGQNIPCLVCATPLRGVGIAWRQVAKSYLLAAWSLITLIVTFFVWQAVVQILRWLAGE
jgi:hypothetical protein